MQSLEPSVENVKQAYPSGCLGDFGVSLTRPSIVCDMVSAIKGVRMLAYM
jgi:hypothetical protein